MATYQELVTDIVREATEPLTIEQIRQRVEERQHIPTKNPRTTIKNALGSSPLVNRVGKDRYVYTPRTATGNSFRILLAEQPETPLALTTTDEGRPTLNIGIEVLAGLNATASKRYERENPVRITLPDGTRATAFYPTTWFGQGFTGQLGLSAELKGWIDVQRRAGADSLVLRCRDGLTADYTLEPARFADLDGATIAARDRQVLAIAREVLGKREINLPEFALQVVARGAYQGEPQPSPLATILYELDGRFVVDFSRITYRADLTPALLRLFADRLANLRAYATYGGGDIEEHLARHPGMDVGAPGEQLDEETEDEDETEAEEGEPDLESRDGPLPPRAPAQHLYRLRVRLDWLRSVWRVIEMLDNQTLDELHEAIQDAFGWDRDHLYAFFMSGKRYDSLTEIGMAPGGWMPSDAEPPYLEDVTLADLDLMPGQHFLYLFDFGDDLEHDIEVLETLPAPASEGDYPRIAEVHGEAPPQYPNLEDDEDELEEGEESDG